MKETVEITVGDNRVQKNLETIEFGKFGQAVLSFEDTSELKVSSKHAVRFLNELELQGLDT